MAIKILLRLFQFERHTHIKKGRYLYLKKYNIVHKHKTDENG